MSTVLFVFAIVSIILKTASIDSLRPMMLQNSWLRVQRALEQDVLLLEPMRFQVLADLQPQFVHVERLGEVVHRAEPHRFDRAVGRRERRHHERDDVAIDVLGRAQHVDAADVRHPDVGEQQIDAFLLEDGDRLVARSRPPARRSRRGEGRCAACRASTARRRRSGCAAWSPLSRRGLRSTRGGRQLTHTKRLLQLAGSLDGAVDHGARAAERQPHA